MYICGIVNHSNKTNKMNKEVYHKTQNKKVHILFNSNKEIIGYNLETFTPIYKRTLKSCFTLDRDIAKQFLK